MKNLFLAVLLLLSYNIHAQFEDDMESYTEGQTVTDAHWTDWGCGGGPGCAILITSEQAQGGSLSGLIPNDGTTDAVLDLGNKIFGDWDVWFYMYVPENKEAYWAIKGGVPESSSTDLGMLFFNKNNQNPGVGLIHNIALGDLSFNFPHNEWFQIYIKVNMNFGILLATWELKINGEIIVPADTPFTDESGNYPDSFGGIEFFSISEHNELYLDTFGFWQYQLSTIDFPKNNFIVFPNPAQDNINIVPTGNSEINAIKIYDTLGRLVFEEDNISSQLQISHLQSGLLFVKLETDKGILTKKIIKE